jgi:hypothetical protein
LEWSLLKKNGVPVKKERRTFGGGLTNCREFMFVLAAAVRQVLEKMKP